MGEALLFTIEGRQYGVWKDRVLSVEDVGAVHRLPFLRSTLAVLAVIGKRTRTLIDLATCLGHAPVKGKGSARAFIMSEDGQVRGFVVEADITTVEAASAIPLPDSLQIPFVEGFLPHEGKLVPLIDVRCLLQQVSRDGKTAQKAGHALKSSAAAEPPGSQALRLVSAGESHLAIHGCEVIGNLPRGPLTAFPLLPEDIDGVAADGERLVPVIDLARRIAGGERGESSVVLEVRSGSATLGLLVDADEGEWKPGSFVVKGLPPVCRTSWSVSAAMHDGRLLPIVDPADVAAGPAGPVSSKPAESWYAPASAFPSLFLKEDVELVELAVQGRRYAIPRIEAEETISVTSLHAISAPGGIVAGVAEHDGVLLPVVDLARMAGESSRQTGDWKMILIRNGDFQALVPTQGIPEARLLKLPAQRGVPVALPFPVVYGCYTEGDAVRLILNIHSLSLHFDESNVTQILPPVEADVNPPTPAENPGETTPGLEEAMDQAAANPAPAAESPAPVMEADAAEAVKAVEEAEAVEAAVAAPEPQEPPAAPTIPTLGETDDVFIVETKSVETQRTEALVSPEKEEQPTPPQPGQPQPAPKVTRHSGWRVPAGLAASVLLIIGAVVGTSFSGLVREPTQPAPASAPAQAPGGPAAGPENRPANGTMYLVREGDTLWDIAQQKTGDPLNYHALAGSNLIKNPDLIFPGQTIQIPSSQKPHSALDSRPDSSMRR